MRIVIAPGASGNAASMQAHVDGLRARGLDAVAIEIPKKRAEDAVDAYLAASGDGADVVIGGQSYGGRVASLLASRPELTFAGLVLLSYPLHRPGGPEWEPRTSHWPSIRCPVLLLSGEVDPFARIDLLRHAVAQRSPRAELVTYRRLGHTLKPVLDDALDRVARFVEAIS
ncbi:MAG: alpha/beta family hydrolase [Candidatus Limnocylindrales bacterium]